MVSQHYAGDCWTGRQPDLERIALHLTRDRTDEGKPGTAVVGGWRQHEGRTTTSLLATGLGIERQPDQIATVRNEQVW